MPIFRDEDGKFARPPTKPKAPTKPRAARKPAVKKVPVPTLDTGATKASMSKKKFMATYNKLKKLGYNGIL